ncbi:MAG: hypothetical protein DRH37_11900 [Deltaproteobacteria bacterium]|nr:MAG: hypothetical protein DRH37_11900 [Deltaproteobacteria bacterium]
MAAFEHYLPKKRAKLKNYVKNSQYSASFISFQKYFTPKTRINYFQEENYAFNINELQKCWACITRINLMRP